MMEKLVIPQRKRHLRTQKRALHQVSGGGISIFPIAQCQRSKIEPSEFIIAYDTSTGFIRTC